MTLVSPVTVTNTSGNSGGGEINRDQAPGLRVVNLVTPGVLKLDLSAGSYKWKLVHIAGKTFSDSGTDTCH